MFLLFPKIIHFQFHILFLNLSLLKASEWNILPFKGLNGKKWFLFPMVQLQWKTDNCVFQVASSGKQSWIAIVQRDDGQNRVLVPDQPFLVGPGQPILVLKIITALPATRAQSDRQNRLFVAFAKLSSSSFNLLAPGHFKRDLCQHFAQFWGVAKN